MNPELAQPLSEAVFYILISLAQGPRHGYAILKKVEELSEGQIHLSTGTLYGALKRMMVQEWIERVDDPQPNPTDRERKAYRLTSQGRRALSAEKMRLRHLLTAADLEPLEVDG